MTTRLLRFPPNDLLKARLLSGARNIAVVGYSRNASKESTVAANCLVNAGFNVVGVNPTAADSEPHFSEQRRMAVPMVPSLRAATRWLAQHSNMHGENSNPQPSAAPPANGNRSSNKQDGTPNSAQTPATIDIVNVFRESSALPEVVAEIKRMPVKPKAVWLHEGVTHPEAERELEKLGIAVVANQCLLSEHIRLRNAIEDDEGEPPSHYSYSGRVC